MEPLLNLMAGVDKGILEAQDCKGVSSKKDWDPLKDSWIMTEQTYTIYVYSSGFKYFSEFQDLCWFICWCFIGPTDAGVSRDVVQSCRSVGISAAGGSAQSSLLSGPCPDPPTLLQPQPPPSTSRCSKIVTTKCFWELTFVRCCWW